MNQGWDEHRALMHVINIWVIDFTGCITLCVELLSGVSVFSITGALHLPRTHRRHQRNSTERLHVIQALCCQLNLATLSDLKKENEWDRNESSGLFQTNEIINTWIKLSVNKYEWCYCLKKISVKLYLD